jgi:chromosome segregation ATPase
MKRKKSIFCRLTLGLLVGALFAPAQPRPAQAQWTVYDPAQYALQIRKKLEEAQRHVQTFNNAVQQLTTLKGVLNKAEELVAGQRNAVNTMSNIGRMVRASLQLKDQVGAIVTTRLTMLKSIDDRLNRGIFDPEADKRDLDEYLRTSIGRRSEDTLANYERLRRMDNTLERMDYELQQLEVKKAQTNLKKAILSNKLNEIERQPESERCASCIANLIDQVADCDALIAQYDAKMEELLTRIEERKLKYDALMEERIRFAEQVYTTTEAWSKFNDRLDELQRTLNTY